jgi:DMSO/TMAO reductase YedYZ molybdopterin-dependent catalytic subunit
MVQPCTVKIVRTGAVVGLALTAALVAVSGVGWAIAGLPFPAFDLFDALTRALPGSIATIGIDSMIAGARLLHVASTGAAAKTVEQALAIASTVVAGGLIGAAAFGALGASDEPALFFGAALGVISGIGSFLVAESLGRIAPDDQFIDGAWLGVLFVAWGFALGWARERTRAPGDAGASPAEWPARRNFLARFIGACAAIGVASAAIAVFARSRPSRANATRWSATHVLPNADAAVAAVPGTRAELTPLADHYRVDVDTGPPRLRAAEWRLTLSGLIDRPIELTLDDIRALPSISQFITLSCISNPVGGDLIGTTRWTGVSVRDVFESRHVDSRATHLKITSADGFSEIISLALVRADPRIILAYAWDDVPLATEHGYPLRLYVPDRYGMKQPKWIVRIEAIDRWEPGYWVERGWDREGLVRPTAAIDAVRVGGTAGEGVHVMVGGIAYAGAKRVSKVEVEIDGGEWRPAALRTPLADTTWVVWRADLILARGEHTFAVRCTDGQGRPQSEPFHTKSAKI